MNSIQEVFRGDFHHARNLLVQKCRPDDHNLGAKQENFSESWPSPLESFDLFGLALVVGRSKREIWVGVVKDVIPSLSYPGRFRFYVDHFRRIGIHNRVSISDSCFYANGGGGGSRVIVRNRGISSPGTIGGDVPGGAMEQRLGWVRKNHKVFRDLVWKHWAGKCAVYQTECNGLLVASHIYPWSLSSREQKTDFNNGLLLSAPLDYLFDRGHISFADSGEILKNPKINSETLAIFGLTKIKSIGINPKNITRQMKKYLQLHRKYHSFPTQK